MAKYYVYRMTHDTGFAPRVRNRICAFGGCTNIPRPGWAEEDSWIIGIGGKTIKQKEESGKLIYAMKVEKIFSYPDFKNEYPDHYDYTTEDEENLKTKERVLVSKNYYFCENNKLISIDSLSKSIKVKKILGEIFKSQYCHCKRIDNKINNEDIEKLIEQMKSQGYKKLCCRESPVLRNNLKSSGCNKQ